MSPTLALLMLATLLATLPWQQVTGQDPTNTITTIMSTTMGEETTQPSGSAMPDGGAETTTMQATTTAGHQGEKSKGGASESAHLSAFTIVSSTLITLMASHL